jgi:hypothetical protein
LGCRALRLGGRLAGLTPEIGHRLQSEIEGRLGHAGSPRAGVGQSMAIVSSTQLGASSNRRAPLLFEPRILTSLEENCKRRRRGVLFLKRDDGRPA